MYEINEATYVPEEFHRGTFPVVTEYGTVKKGASVKKYAPIALGSDGLEEATAATLNQLVGIAADDSDESGNIVYYQTGEFNSEAVVLPEGITLEELKTACRQLSIFLK